MVPLTVTCRPSHIIHIDIGLYVLLLHVAFKECLFTVVFILYDNTSI